MPGTTFTKSASDAARPRRQTQNTQKSRSI
jgi:hypothetical protein